MKASDIGNGDSDVAKVSSNKPLVIEDSSKKEFLGEQYEDRSPSPDNSFQDDALGFDEDEEGQNPLSSEKPNHAGQLGQGLPENSFELQLDMSRINIVNENGPNDRSSSAKLNKNVIFNKISSIYKQNNINSRPPTDDEGLQSSQKQKDTKGPSVIQTLINSISQKKATRQSRYEVSPQPKQQQVGQDDNSERGFLHGEYDETTNMLSQPNVAIEFPEYKLIMFIMVFTPVFFILFFLPHPIFTVLHFLHAISTKTYESTQIIYITLLSLTFTAVNFHVYYKVKKEKKEAIAKKEESNQFNKIFQKDSDKLVTAKNFAKIFLINLVCLIGLIDTAFDVQFVALCYGSGIVWLAIIVGLLYIFTFFDKIHSTRKLIAMSRDQYKKRFDRYLLKSDAHKQIQFYSSCLSIFALPIAEIFTRTNLVTLNLQRRILIFEGGHIALQKLVFVALKSAYYLLNPKNKSGMISYSIPMNFICGFASLGYILYKFRDLKQSKKTEDLSHSGSQVKRFTSQVTSNSIRFRQEDVSNLLKLEEVISQIEDARKKAGATLGSHQIDKLKVKLLEGDLLALKGLVGILKKQHFLREVSFYKMKFTSDPEFEYLSDIMYIRKYGLNKVSFKECSMTESMISKMIQKPDLNESSVKLQVVKDITLQLKVHDQTDYEVVYQQIRKLIEHHPVQILFEPLYYSKRKEDSIFSKISQEQLSLLGESQYWPQAVASEYQHVKRFNLVSLSKEFKGQIFLFKDRTLQALFDRAMFKRIDKKDGELDLSNIRDILTHSYHQERFLELFLRALEDNIDQVTHLKVKLINEQAFQQKFSYIAMRPTQFKTLLHVIPDRQIIDFHLNMSMFSFQDTKSIEHIFGLLSDFIEVQARTLKALSFTEVTFDLNSMQEKEFYNSLSFPNLTSLSLDNCKFACYDAFERFFSALTDTENTLERLIINRVNSSVSAKGFKELILSQCESLKELSLQCVHKNIMSRKYHRKVLPAIAQCPNLRILSLRKNQLDYERLKVLSDKMDPEESFLELTSLDLSQNQLENNSILTIYKMLKHREFSLDYLDLSENAINEEGLNLLLKGKTNQGGFLLTKGIVANKMMERNFLLNNAKASKLDRIEVSGSFAPGQDPSVAVQGFQLLGILNNTLTVLDVSNNHLSHPQVQSMIDRFFLSKLCNLISLNLSSLRFNEENLESLFTYIKENPTLESLSLNDCKLRDGFGAKILYAWLCPSSKANKFRCDLNLEGNMLGEQLFLNLIDELDEDEQNHGRDKSIQCQKVNLGRNQLTDEAIGNDLIRVLTRLHARILSLDLHENPLLGRLTLTHLREFVEDNKALAFTEIDFSNCPKCLKSAVLFEMRSSPGITVKYTRDQPKVKAKKK